MSDTANELRDAADRLGLISHDIHVLVREAARVIARVDNAADIWSKSTYSWIAAIESAISPESKFTGGPNYRMIDAVTDLRELANEADAGVFDGPDFFDELNDFEEWSEVE
jgi:hypothetical protein